MEGYRFAAERQLIFHVPVGGQSRLVQFGERNGAGASNFITLDEKIADAIRLTSLFRRGVIKETTELRPKPAEKPAVTMVKPTVKATEEVDRPSEEEEATVTKAAENVIEVKNFTQAKTAVAKRLGLSKNAVKTPTLLAQVAKEAGLEIKYIE